MQTPNYIDIVLIGGGHAHAQVIKMWAMNSVPGVRLSLINPSSYTPYSGMLPGLIAGHYNFEQTHIDLRKLCQFAGVRFIKASVSGINRDNKSIQLDEQPDIHADIISINSGIVPDQQIKGAQKFAIGVKPIARFHQKWLQLLQDLEQEKGGKISIVGAGIAGVELSLAIDFRLKQLGLEADIQLAFAHADILPNTSNSVRTHCRQALNTAGIKLHSNFVATEFTASQVLSKGNILHSDFHILCTQATPPSWVADSGIDCDEQGFIQLNDQLQSINTPWLFAAGDIAQQIQHPRPQAGVFAVRQGPVLFKNLCHFALGKKLKQHRPQLEFLKIITLGDKYAVATRGSKALAGKWVWHWKNRIDQKFMTMFNQLKPMPSPAPTKKISPIVSGLSSKAMQQQAMRCGGCGAKVGGSILSRVIAQLKITPQDSVLLGVHNSDDAAVLELNNIQPQLFLQSVDNFKGLVSDPYQQGQLAALHALSDIYAMGGKAHSAQALVNMPYAGDAITERDLLLLMQGANQALREHQCQLIGGHSSEGTELSLGFCINGLIKPDQLLKKNQLVAGLHLVLTKPLGSGVLFAGHSQLKTQSRHIDSALQSMLQSNQQAADIAQQFKASACTDITGFGLAGHLQEMLKGSGLGADINLAQLPTYPGAKQCSKDNIHSSLFEQNKKLVDVTVTGSSKQAQANLVYDPQTCGGLLIAVNSERVDDLLQALHSAGYPYSRDVAVVNANGGIRLH